MWSARELDPIPYQLLSSKSAGPFSSQTRRHLVQRNDFRDSFDTFEVLLAIIRGPRLWQATERLRHDPAMRWIVGGKAAQSSAASPSQMGASRRNGSRRPRTSLLLPTCLASGSTLCTAEGHPVASCSTWIQA